MSNPRNPLLTTHYLAEADALAERISVIDRGRVIAEGSPSEIKGSATGRTIRFHSAATLERIRMLRPGLTVRRSGDRSEVLTDAAEDVTRRIAAYRLDRRTNYA